MLGVDEIGCPVTWAGETGKGNKLTFICLLVHTVYLLVYSIFITCDLLEYDDVSATLVCL